MEAEAVALIIASIGGCIASVIYALKHIRSSECCGSKCTQDTENSIQITQNDTKITEI